MTNELWAHSNQKGVNIESCTVNVSLEELIRSNRESKDAIVKRPFGLLRVGTTNYSIDM